MKVFRVLALLLGAALLGVVSSVEAASGSLRLSGGFFQYQPEMLAWEPWVWRSVLDQMKAARMNLVLIQMLASELSDGTAQSFVGPMGQEDATEAILNYADTNDFQVFLGLYLPRWGADMTASDFLNHVQVNSLAVAQQAFDRYLRATPHRSFAGWYLPLEPWTRAYQPAEIARLQALFRNVSAGCRQISGDWPLAISPFISSERPPPCEVERLYTQLLDQSGIGLVLLQDSVGAQRWEQGVRERVAPYAAAFQRACAATGVRLWANLESFRITDGQFLPSDATRLKRQFDACAPYVEKFITFDFLNYMNPVAFVSSWTSSRRDRMQQFYADYLADFVAAEYAPFAPPQVTASLNGNRFTLRWLAEEGDSFSVQFNTRLDGSGWAPLGTGILTNGAERVVALELGNPPAQCFYRIAKCPKLAPPDNLVRLLPGAFVMGTASNDVSRTTYELASFPVELTYALWMGRYEVSQSEYQNLMCTNPSAFQGNLDAPVENVSWQNAVDFCAKLTQQELQAGRLTPEMVYRLPTEAEWEYAARAGSTSFFGVGDTPERLADCAWYDANSQARTHLVGQLQANAWGLFDLQGNVMEWCWDWVTAVPTQPVMDLVGSTNGVVRAVRGGAWDLPAKDCRCGWRTRLTPAVRLTDLGFRIVLVPAR